MNKFTLEQLESIALKIHEKFNLQEASFVDISEVADEMGIDVYEGDFEDKQIHGAVLCTDNEREIYVSGVLDEKNKRYTIAVQLAKIILGHDAKYTENDYVLDYSVPFKGALNIDDFGEKTQADILGACLLIPLKPLQKVFKEAGDSVDVIADIFKVSKRCAYIRLDNLGLLN